LSTSVKRQDGEKESVFDIIIESLKNCGYAVFPAVLDSKTLLPHERKRLYIVGICSRFREGSSRFRFPKVPILKRGISQILHGAEYPEHKLGHLILDESQWRARLQAAPPSAYLINTEEPSSTVTKSYRRHGGRAAGKRHFEHTQQRLKLLVPMPSGTERDSEADTHAPAGASSESSHNAEEKMAPRPRFFSGRECARLQGFPEEFRLVKERRRDSPMASLFGNAVSPPMITLIAGAMIDAFSYERGGAAMRATLVHLEARFKARLGNMFAQFEERRDFPQPNLDAGVGAALLGLFRSIPEGRHKDLERSIVRCLSSSTGGRMFEPKPAKAVVFSYGKAECIWFQRTRLCPWDDACRFLHIGQGVREFIPSLEVLNCREVAVIICSYLMEQ